MCTYCKRDSSCVLAVIVGMGSWTIASTQECARANSCVEKLCLLNA